MDVTFDSGKHDKKPMQTRIYAPTHKAAPRQSPLSRLEEDVLAVQPQPDEIALAEILDPTPPPVMSMQSKVLLLLAIFMVAGTILFGLRGNAEITEIYKQISEKDTEIRKIEEEISQIKKEQGTTGGYAAIFDTNIEAGRISTWGVD